MEKARDDAHEMLRICESLLHHQPRSVAQGAVREGDVFALMIKHHHGEGQLSQAYDLVRQMQVSDNKFFLFQNHLARLGSLRFFSLYPPLLLPLLLRTCASTLACTLSLIC